MPIERNLSAYFESCQILTSFYKDELTNDEQISLFKTKYTHNVILKWFDENIKSTLDVGVFVSFPSNYDMSIWRGS